MGKRRWPLEGIEAQLDFLLLPFKRFSPNSFSSSFFLGGKVKKGRRKRNKFVIQQWRRAVDQQATVAERQRGSCSTRKRKQQVRTMEWTREIAAERKRERRTREQQKQGEEGEGGREGGKERGLKTKGEGRKATEFFVRFREESLREQIERGSIRRRRSERRRWGPRGKG